MLPRKYTKNQLKQQVKFIGNKIIDKILKPKPAPDGNTGNVEKIKILPEKREKILNNFRQKRTS